MNIRSKYYLIETKVKNELEMVVVNDSYIFLGLELWYVRCLSTFES